MLIIKISGNPSINDDDTELDKVKLCVKDFIFKENLIEFFSIEILNYYCMPD